MSGTSEDEEERFSEEGSDVSAAKISDYEYPPPKLLPNNRRRQLRWSVEDEILLIEWMRTDDNYSRFKLDCVFPDGRKKLGMKQTLSEKAVVFLKSNGVDRAADQVYTKINSLVKAWQEADELSQAFDAAHSAIFSPENELQDIMDNGTRENILHVCRHWDMLDPVLRPVREKAKRATLITEAKAVVAEYKRAELAEMRKTAYLETAYTIGTPIAPRTTLTRPTLSAGQSAAPVQQLLLIPVSQRSSIEIKCAVCGISTDGPCVVHTKRLKDGMILPRSYATLPEDLIISENDGKRVMSNVDILEPTVFGPLIGTLIDHREDLQSDLRYVLSVPEDGLTRFFCLKSDDYCNWMKFVRLVREASEANLIVFQQQGGIYLSSFKPVNAGEELVGVYSTSYARTVEEAIGKLAATSARRSTKNSTAFYSAFLRKPAPPLKITPSTTKFLAKVSALPNFLPGEEEVDSSFEVDSLSAPQPLEMASSDSSPKRRPAHPNAKLKVKPVLRRSTRNTDKAQTLTSELNGLEDQNGSMPEANYEDLYDSGSDWVPEEEKTKNRELSEEPVDSEVHLPPVQPLEKVSETKMPRRRRMKNVEDMARLNVERAAAQGQPVDYQKELERIKRKQTVNKERYRAQRYGEFTPLPVTLDMLENDPKDRMRTVQEIMSIEHLIKQLEEAQPEEQDVGLLSVAKECLEREQARSCGIKRRRFTRRIDLGKKIQKTENKQINEEGHSQDKEAQSEVETTKKKKGKKNKVTKEPKKPKVRKVSKSSTLGSMELHRERAKHRIGKFSAHYRYATFACDECDTGFRLQALLDLHRISHGKTLDNPPSLTCPGCDMVLESMDELLHHVKKHQRRCPLKLRKVTDFQCQICKQCYNTEAFLKRHMSTVHPPGGKKAVTYDVPKFPCPQCGKVFLTAPGLGSHERTHKGRFAECIICLEHFNNSVDLYHHVTEKHKVDGVFQCRLCERTYAEYVHMKQHMKQYHRPKNLSCDKCPKMFKNEEHLRRHYVCHQNVFPFECETCGRKFKRKKNYDGHMATLHKDDRDYSMKGRSEKIATAFAKAVVCEYCTRQYQNKKRLLIHQREKHLELLPHELRIGKMDDETGSRSSSEESEEY